jgi:threonine/homoserine/homoserine lactone efflux protein
MPLKNKIIIAVMLLGSAYFLYQGFSLLFHGENQAETIEKAK